MRLLMVSACVRLRAMRCCPVWRALKWFCPGLRAISLPFLVTLMRFVNDLFVFILDIKKLVQFIVVLQKILFTEQGVHFIKFSLHASNCSQFLEIKQFKVLIGLRPLGNAAKWAKYTVSKPKSPVQK